MIKKVTDHPGHPFFWISSLFFGGYPKKYWTFRKEWFMQVTTLVRRRQPSLNTLNLLLEVEPFPGPDPESEFSFSPFASFHFDWSAFYTICVSSYTAQFDFVPSEKLYELCTYKT